MTGRRSDRRRGAALVLWLSCLAVVSTATAGESTYDHLRSQQLDGRRVELGEFVLRRDVFTLRLDGEMHFLAKAAGRDYSAVFVGQGSFELDPATDDERAHLTLLGQGDGGKLTDRFDSLVLYFSDDTAAELLAAGPLVEGEPSEAAARALDRAFNKQRKIFRTNFQLRVLADLLADAPERPGVFYALMDGKELPPSLLGVDPLGAEAIIRSGELGAEESIFLVVDDHAGAIWYLSHLKAEVADGTHRSCRPKSMTDAEHYEIRTRIGKNEELSGTTEIRFRPRVGSERVLGIRLLPTLRIEQAAWIRGNGEDGTVPLQIVQEGEERDADAAVVFPEPIPAGEEIVIRLDYAGDEVVFDYGRGSYAVAARASWYPNLGTFRDPATFDMTFRVPGKEDLIAVGTQVDSKIDDGESVVRWKSDVPLQVAGFNYGRFQHRSQVDEYSGVRAEVYTSRGSTLEDNALADALNSLRLFSSVFGKLPFERVAVSEQVQWNFGQAWPTLVFLPAISFINETSLAQSGIYAFSFLDTVGPHEMSHQWWGHLVGWESYRDQWLSEGLATFSANLLIQQTDGWKASDKIYKEQQKFIGEKHGAVKNYQAGPISRGWRLRTPRSKAAYSAMAYDKGAFVIHMLRMMMIDPRADEPDARFFAMLRDFASTYAGKHPSTDDFKAVVERHLVPEMNATGDGKLDWFFDQWIHGTEIPRFESTLRLEKAGGGEYRIHGTVSQQGVSDSFVSLVPVYVDFGNKGRAVLFGRLPFRGSTSRDLDTTVEIPGKPKAVVLNAHYDVLALD